MPRFLLSAIFLCAWITTAASEDAIRIASDDAMQVTSDTPSYCIDLAQRLDGRTDLPPEARSLSVEGRRMCQSGHVLGGLARVRRAMLLRRGEGH